MKCPFVYASGKKCEGNICTIKIIKADLDVAIDENDKVTSINIFPRYHAHLFCDKKGNHAGYKGLHPDEMKVWYDELPQNIVDQITKEEVRRR